MKHEITKPGNEVKALLTGALQVAAQCQLSELCTEALLYALADNNQLAANSTLKKLGVNVIGLKATLLKRLERAKEAPLLCCRLAKARP